MLKVHEPYFFLPETPAAYESHTFPPLLLPLCGMPSFPGPLPMAPHPWTLIPLLLCGVSALGQPTPQTPSADRYIVTRKPAKGSLHV